jgi:hypothetical protein
MEELYEKEWTRRIDLQQSFDKLIKRNIFQSVDPNINEKSFFEEKPALSFFTLRLFGFTGIISNDFILKSMEEKAFRPATIIEAVDFIAEKKELFKWSLFPLIGSKGRGARGAIVIPIITAIGGRLYLNLRPPQKEWTCKDEQIIFFGTKR